MAGILTLQYKQIPGNKKANILKVTEMLAANSDKELDLVILPEFFSTGIYDEMYTDTEPADGGETVKAISLLAKKYKTNIISGTVVEKDGDKLYNTMYVLDREGKTVGKYRKIHLFAYMGGTEDKALTPGSKEVILDLDFARVGLSICFDIRYPLHHRKLAQGGAEIIVSPSAFSYPASLSDEDKASFINTWRAMNITRATENLVYFVTSNLFGKSYPYLYSIGNSMISDPWGRVLGDAKDEETAVYADISLLAGKDIRKVYPACHIS